MRPRGGLLRQDRRNEQANLQKLLPKSKSTRVYLDALELLLHQTSMLESLTKSASLDADIRVVVHIPGFL
jgi:hypothetical protein